MIPPQIYNFLSVGFKRFYEIFFLEKSRSLLLAKVLGTRLRIFLQFLRPASVCYLVFCIEPVTQIQQLAPLRAERKELCLCRFFARRPFERFVADRAPTFHCKTRFRSYSSCSVRSPCSTFRAYSTQYLAHGFASSLALLIGLSVPGQIP